MKQLQQFLFFLVYSNLFIAACAVLMLQQTAYLFLGNETNQDLVSFVFFSTLCSYNFHYYFTTQSVVPSQRIAWQKKNRAVHIVLFIIGLAGAVFFFIRLKTFWPWLLPAVIATFLYSAPKIPHSWFQLLRKIAIGKTIFLSFIWMYVTAVLPIIVTGVDWNSSFTVYAVSRFFYIYCISILFDYRDRADDKIAGVRSLITFLNEKNITRLFIFSWAVFALFTGLLLNYHIGILPVLCLLVPGILLAFLYNYARRNFSDMVYYVILDGLMALSALLMLLPLRS